MDKKEEPGEAKPMNVYWIIATFLAGVVMGPVAWWQNDPLILALAALIPFTHHLLSGAAE